MFFLVSIGLWFLGNKLEQIGDELIAMANEPEDLQPQEVQEAPSIPPQDGLFVDPDELFRLRYRMN